MSQVDGTCSSDEIDYLAEALRWARLIVAHNCRGKAEIQNLRVLIKAVEENSENPGND